MTKKGSRVKFQKSVEILIFYTFLRKKVRNSHFLHFFEKVQKIKISSRIFFGFFSDFSLNHLKWRDLLRFHDFRKVIIIFHFLHCNPHLLRNIAKKLKKRFFLFFGQLLCETLQASSRKHYFPFTVMGFRSGKHFKGLFMSSYGKTREG